MINSLVDVMLEERRRQIELATRCPIPYVERTPRRVRIAAALRALAARLDPPTPPRERLPRAAGRSV